MLRPDEHVLCRLDDLAEGAARGFDLAGHGQPGLFIVRLRDLVHAYVDSCPHHDTPMAWRRDAYLNAAGDRIVCAAHGAQFEIDTGLCVLGPCLGERLRAVPWRLVAGEIAIARESIPSINEIERQETPT
jgi:nitrite reductase/ring-hydroxylating ferredoxin subunit